MADKTLLYGAVIFFFCFVVVKPMQERSRYGYVPQRASYGRISYRPQKTYYKPAPKKTYQTYDPRALKHYSPPRKQSYVPVKQSYQPVKQSYQPVKQSYQPVKQSYRPVKQSYRPVKKSYRPVMYIAKEAPVHYDQPKQEPKIVYKAEEYDPCSEKHEGDYMLGGEFKSVFPYVDSRCYFVKCANYKSFLNPCGIGTRNDDYGDGFCSHLDYEGACGLALGSYHKQQDTGYGDIH